MTDAKMNAIEETLAHQEQRIQDLSDVVARQWDEIDRLKKLVSLMRDKMTSPDGAANREDSLSTSEIAAMNKPPHY